MALSKFVAKRATGAVVITQARGGDEAWLLATVERLAGQAGIGMPEVAIFPSKAPNAFATGARRNHALVAVSAGLLRTMNKQEVEAVLAHEVAHVANGDMITLDAITGSISVDLSEDELAERRKGWSGPRATNYQSGALWKYAQLVGEIYKGAVTHPGGKAEKHSYMDL